MFPFAGCWSRGEGRALQQGVKSWQNSGFSLKELITSNLIIVHYENHQHYLLLIIFIINWFYMFILWLVIIHMWYINIRICQQTIVNDILLSWLVIITLLHIQLYNHCFLVDSFSTVNYNPDAGIISSYQQSDSSGHHRNCQGVPDQKVP